MESLFGVIDSSFAVIYADDLICEAARRGPNVQTNKLSLHLFSVRLLSFIMIFIAFRPFITYNCQRYPVLNVKICSIWIVRNVCSFAGQIGLRDVHKASTVFRKFCPPYNKQVIACFLVKLRISLTCVFRSCRICPCRFPSPAIYFCNF